jgi:hypothetical protein
MIDNLIHPKDKPADEPIIIADECGDSMWDAVLNQEARKTCDGKESSSNASLLLNSLHMEQESGPSTMINSGFLFFANNLSQHKTAVIKTALNN